MQAVHHLTSTLTSVMGSKSPPKLGERLLPTVLDEIANSDPSRTLYSVLKTKDAADGFLDISARQFARAVDRCAWHLESNLGKSGAASAATPRKDEDFPTIAYVGPQDLIYAIIMMGSMKAGYKVLLPSPRNTLEANLNLLEKTNCQAFCTPPNFPLPVVKQILEARPMKTLDIPGLPYWLEEDVNVEHYPYDRTYAEAKHEPFVVLHTSGSTGLPKPVVQRHATHAIVDSFAELDPPVYPAMCAGTRVYNGNPLFHCAGIIMLLPGTIYNGYTCVLGPFPPSPEAVNGIITHGNVAHASVPPMILVELAKKPEYFENLSKVKQLTYGGGPLPKEVGDRIIAKARVYNCLGTTENGVIPLGCPDLEDWQYLQPNPAFKAEYHEVSEGMYEQVLVRGPNSERYQGVFGTFPDLEEWPTKDLYSKHPTKANTWLYRGRNDDIIVFYTGEKINPVDTEDLINGHPAISSALVGGSGKFQSCLLAEAVKPPTSEAERDALLEDIWSTVEAANKESLHHGRIHKHMITFTSPDKPMARAGKGTVQRKATMDLYATELEALYEESERGVNGTAKGANSGTNGIGPDVPVEDAVRHIIATSSTIDIHTIQPTTDLFEMGLDSLQVALITRRFNEYLSSINVAQRAETKNIYAYPSIGGLTSIISSLRAGGASRDSESDKEKMEKLLHRYGSELPISVRPSEAKPKDQFVVLITGTTGSLGSYALDSLMKDSRVTRVYCLNRGPDSTKRQQTAMAARGLQPLSSNVVCFDTDISKPYFGLPVKQYSQLLREVTTVIHNAWQVDFNLSIESFAGHIGTARRFIDFSASSRFGAHVFFISSVSAVSGSPEISSTTIAERGFQDWSMPQPIGYGESKFVAERLFEEGAKMAGTPISVLRVGQVAGPTTVEGMWPKQEWFPSMLASSKHLGLIPESLAEMDSIDWVPVDVLGRSLVELATAATNANDGKPSVGAEFFHAANPKRSSWAELLPIVTKHLSNASTGQPVKVVPTQEWVAALRQSAETSNGESDALEKNPAIKLLGFFEEMARQDGKRVWLDTEKSVKVSPSLAGLSPVGEAWMENWLRQWSF